MSRVAVVDTQRFRLSVVGDVIPAAQWHAAEQAHALLEDANQSLMNARKEAERRHQQGYERGYEDGRAAGIDTFSRAIEALSEARDELAASMHEQALELAIAVVDRIAPRIGSDKLVPALVAEAVQHLAMEPTLTIRVHKEVAEPVRERCDAMDSAALPNLEVVADEDLAEFDCVIETRGGLVNAGFDKQLQQVSAILAAARSEAENHREHDDVR